MNIKCKYYVHYNTKGEEKQSYLYPAPEEGGVKLNVKMFERKSRFLVSKTTTSAHNRSRTTASE